MQLPKQLDAILQNALDGNAPTKEQCIYLLDLPAASLEVGLLTAAANAVSRHRFDNQAMVMGQMGLETTICPGGCAFCMFGEGHSQTPDTELPLEEIIRRSRSFADGGAYGIFLMTMHTFGFERFLGIAEALRNAIPPQTRVWANVGDIDAVQARELRAAGVSGIYHVCRLREGIDTRLEPEIRKATIRIAREAGLDWFNSCEPIGPEHHSEELVEQIFLGIEYECTQHAAMRRFSFDASPLYHYGQLTHQRLAQIVAVIALATLECESIKSIAVHDANLLGLNAGANAFYAECGDEPPDLPQPLQAEQPAEDDSEGFTSATWRQSLPITTADCRRMFYEAGYSHLMRGDNSATLLTLDKALKV